MDINSSLTKLSEILPKIVKFLFNSKATIPIIIGLIILYFFWLGMKKEKKEILPEKEIEEKEIKENGVYAPTRNNPLIA